MPQNSNTISVELLTNNAATACRGNVKNYRDHLVSLRKSIISDAKHTAQQDSISIIKDYETKIGTLNTTIAEINSNRNKITLRIKELLTENENLKNGIVSVSKLNLVILSVCSILLTVFLCLFYSATVYGATNQLRGAKEALSAALDAVGYIFELFPDPASIFYLLVPIIFISMGYLIHNSKNRNTKYSFLIVTFIVDCILGYLMTKKILIQDDRNIHWSKIFYSPDFYLLLFMGFVAYLIWGKLVEELNRTIELLNPLKAIALNKNELAKIEIEEIQINEKIKLHQIEIEKLSNNLEKIKNGVVFIPFNTFEGYISKSNSEWSGYLTRYQILNGEDLNIAIKDIQNISAEFIEETKTTVASDYIIE